MKIATSFLLVTLLCWLPYLALAQNPVLVKGTVLQTDTRKPVPGAGVFILNKNTGTVSDSNGVFQIRMLPTDTLLIRAIGYKPSLYLLPKQRLNVVTIKVLLQEDEVLLKEVEITNRPSDEQINRAMRNMQPRPAAPQPKPNPTVVIEQKNPGAPPPEPTIMNPASFLYEQFSKEGKQKQKLREIYEQQAADSAQKERREYNRFFKDNTGYEVR
ncbi:MAG: carboxypeptidase-like regulatory domain-containing protein [Hymenobacteraceae bacterium]|nr:carboxypeptidase-like regulatory domain-containing protein [Hymenobacteraceae bacterium]MDX5394736.1 carboxypeptidase-like regulatory domain-containing protein [Hymenobacteraceae bacterium]MDX5510769.1 carboxypeptidase-like regulatory domain-containing protein [Hymenobacteraceae bacterium]